MRGWPFSKPKTPGFGISRGFFLTVLSSRPVLPSVVEIANPGGAGGAVTGMAVPLGTSAEKEALIRPMERGAYAIASNDRKTVLRMVVMSKEEAHYDPESFVQSSMAVGTDAELIARMRGTWTISQLTFESHDPAVYPALDFLLEIVVRLASLSEGVVADSICQRYRLPELVSVSPRVNPTVDVRDHVSVKFEKRSDGIHAYTLGMQKFALDEYEILNLEEGDHTIAQRFLLTVGQNTLMGRIPKAGEWFGSIAAPFEFAEGGFDKGLWEGLTVLEMRPPTSMTPGEALGKWEAESG